ncbi:vitelline membrane outer layer protein 1-like [Panulirus ornatus]|uniref:vitelline membrane outer layer protein 1-like n=1 Tax=Panulirus ornatus TaxID=150431 RepID=UPI003A8B0713
MNAVAVLAILACCLLAAAENSLETGQDSSKTTTPEDLRRNFTAELKLNNGLAWGSWGPAEFCEDGSYVYAFEIKYEAYSSVDDTGVNGVKLYCRNEHEHDTGYVTSTIGQYGYWQGMRICSNGFITGMRGNVLEPQGLFGDDVAVENLEMRCNHSPEIHTGFSGIPTFPLGKWSAWSECPTDSRVCGLTLRYEDPVVADDAATTDMIMYCC